MGRLTAERAELANGVDSEHPALVAFKKHQNIETLNREILIDLVNYIKIFKLLYMILIQVLPQILG